MKNKIIGIVICLLLIWSTTTLAFTPLNKDGEQTEDQFVERTSGLLPISKRWMKTYGGIGMDLGNSVQQTTDGGYIITGYTDSFGAGESDIWLIKTDRNGYEEWNKTFGGTNNDIGRFVQQTIDGGYIITGYTELVGTGDRVICLIKTNGIGEKIWEKTFRGTVSDFSSIGQQTTDGGYIITGGTDSISSLTDRDVLLIKTDSNGDEVWNKTFGGKYYDIGDSVQQTADGGYIVTAETQSFGISSGLWVIKTDHNGNKVWDKKFGESSHNSGFSVQQTTDGGYIIIGWIDQDINRSVDISLIKIDENGNKLWEKIFGGAEWDSSESIQQTSDDGFIIAGITTSFGAGSDDVWLIKTDEYGNEEWNKTFGGNGQDLGSSVQQTTDGGYIITGYTLSFDIPGDVWLIKTDSQGKSQTTSSTHLCFEWLFQRFPNAFPLLRQIMGY